MEDANANNQDAHRKIARATVGRLTGNFKIDEDMKLASAYVFVTTNAAVGTDQDGETYWKKICNCFIQHGGFATCTIVSLKNRFNKVLQAEVNKYVGCLHAALREYHSGWLMTDYATKGKSNFANKQGKLFKHDIAYDILRRSLPKNEISIDTIHPKVAWALALLDSDREHALERDVVCVAAKFPVANIAALLNSGNYKNVDNNVEAEPVLTADDASATDSSRHCALLDLAITVTPCPSIGKKKAKAIAQAASANKKMKVHLPLPRSDSISNTS